MNMKFAWNKTYKKYARPVEFHKFIQEASDRNPAVFLFRANSSGKSVAFGLCSRLCPLTGRNVPHYSTAFSRVT